MRYGLFVIVLFFGSLKISAGADPKYPVNQIPEDLKKGMYAVIRDSKTEIKISNTSKLVWHEYKAITIFNVKGNRNGIEAVYYDKLSKVNFFKGTVYDAQGNVIKRLKGNEIEDQSAVSGFSLYEDDRVKVGDLRQAQYPYTVEFEYEVEYEFSVFYSMFPSL